MRLDDTTVAASVVGAVGAGGRACVVAFTVAVNADSPVRPMARTLYQYCVDALRPESMNDVAPAAVVPMLTKGPAAAVARTISNPVSLLLASFHAIVMRSYALAVADGLVGV